MYGLDNNSGINVMPAVAPAVSPTPLWFTDGGANQPPSYPGQDWFNIIMAELLNVLADADITPNKGDLTQLSKAINKIISRDSLLIKNNLSEIKAAGPTAIAQTLLNLGLGDAAKLGVASNAQMQTGTSTTLLPTVAAVMSLFSKRSFSINDYIRIPDVPGGLIIQWGTTAGTDANGLVNVTLPTNFPSSNGLCAICAYYSGSRNSISTQIASITQTTMQMFASQSTTGAAAVGAPLRYIVIGF